MQTPTPKIDLREGTDHSHEDLEKTLVKPAKKKSFYKKVPFYLIATILVLVCTFTYKVITSGESIAATFKKIPFLGQIGGGEYLPSKKLLGEDHDRINILLLGMGGEGHDGAYLTDTIILASIKPSTKQIAMLSIPRDLSVPIEDLGWRKINSINAYAEAKEEGNGGLATTEAISQLLNLPITYYARVDFTGFVNIVNDLEGLDIDVENTLDDYQYPILGAEDVIPISDRTEHLHIDSGQQHMDGETALKYVRSRHAMGIEGSDFARSRRQQKVLLAFKDQVFSWKTILNPKKIKSLLDNYDNHVSTNISVWEILRLTEILKEFDLSSLDQINNVVLDDAPGGYLHATISDAGAYVLLPRSGDFSDIQKLAENIFADKASKATTSKKTVAKKTSHTRLEILNGTEITGFAGKTQERLENMGYKIVYIGNAEEQEYQKTALYDFTKGKKPETLKLLREKLSANIIYSLPNWYDADDPEKSKEKADFLIILGTKTYTAEDYL